MVKDVFEPFVLRRMIVPRLDDGNRASMGAPTRLGSLCERSSALKNRYSAPTSKLQSWTSPQSLHTFCSSVCQSSDVDPQFVQRTLSCSLCFPCDDAASNTPTASNHFDSWRVNRLWGCKTEGRRIHEDGLMTHGYGYITRWKNKVKNWSERKD